MYIVLDIPVHNSTSQFLSFAYRSMVHKFNNVSLMCDLVDKEHTCFEVVVQNREWVEY